MGADADSTVAGAVPDTQTSLAPGSSVDPGRKPMLAATRMLFVGTSLTAGYGLPDPALAWPAEVGRIAKAAGYAVEVQNAGVSGETSAGALRRMDWLLKAPAEVVVIETGANDGLRGQSVGDLERNLTAIIGKVRAAQPGAQVVLVQMEAPPNMGGSYATAFRGVYGRVAQATGVTLTPFLLDGVAGVARYNQADGIHPTVEGAKLAAKSVWPVLRGVLDRVTQRPAGAM